MKIKKVLLGTIIAAGLFIPAGLVMATEVANNETQNTQTECTGDCIGGNGACDGTGTREMKRLKDGSGENRGNGTGTRTMQRLQDGTGENCDGTCVNE